MYVKLLRSQPTWIQKTVSLLPYDYRQLCLLSHLYVQYGVERKLFLNTELPITW
jgi:hypothetical protein